jgi:cyclophilin family peptidyl-prolyl cis-trans isomerase
MCVYKWPVCLACIRTMLVCIRSIVHLPQYVDARMYERASAPMSVCVCVPDLPTVRRALQPWLDSKHTIFGRCISGLDIVHAIEKARVDKNDKPLEDIRIERIDVR